MSGIKFIQYLRPDGRTREMITPAVDNDTFAKAEALKSKGYRFEAEVLRTGEVFIDVMDRSRDNEIANELSPNGPKIDDAVVRLVQRAYDRVFSKPARKKGERRGKA